MMSSLFGVIIVLHGLVHLLYWGQSARRFTLKPGMVWPDGSWAFSRPIGDAATRTLASLSFVLVGIVLTIGGIGLIASPEWWRPMVVGGATVSSIAYILFWNGRMENLDAQGIYGVLIDIAILAAVLVLRWPQ